MPDKTSGTRIGRACGYIVTVGLTAVVVSSVIYLMELLVRLIIHTF